MDLVLSVLNFNSFCPVMVSGIGKVFRIIHSAMVGQESSSDCDTRFEEAGTGTMNGSVVIYYLITAHTTTSVSTAQ